MTFLGPPGTFACAYMARSVPRTLCPNLLRPVRAPFYISLPFKPRKPRLHLPLLCAPEAPKMRKQFLVCLLYLLQQESRTFVVMRFGGSS